MKAVAVIVGMVLTIALYIGIVLCWSHFFPSRDTQSHDVPENVPLFIFSLICFPAAMLFLGSISTGVIIEPEMEERSYLALIFYSPAFYFNLIAGMLYVASLFANSVFTFFAGRHSLSTAAPGAFWSYLIIPAVLLFWHAASWAGTALGYKLRAKISGDN